MFIARIAIAFILITAFLLVGAYVVTKNKQYLIVFKRLARYTFWLLVILLLFNVITRVIRF